jgi:putative phage-type endonuclease
MQPVIIYCEQGSLEWFAARLGRVTSGHFDDVLSNGSCHKTYMEKLLAERMTGERMENYTNKAMENGITLEPDARIYYEGLHGVTVEQVGLIQLGDDIAASPDGLVGDDGLIEIKCPFPNTHLHYILSGKLPSEYKAQVQGGLWVSGRQWTDFISFDPRVKSRPFWSIRVERDEKYIKDLAKAVQVFAEELQTLTEKVSTPF